MTERPAPPPDEQPDEPTRRAHLDEVFGDVLPDPTRDERRLDDGGASSRDDDLLRDVPPHHG